MPFLGDLGFWKIVIIAVVVLILFGGATRLPIFAKGLGQSVKVFRKEIKDVTTDIKSERKTEAQEEKDAPVYYTAEPPSESDSAAPGSRRS